MRIFASATRFLFRQFLPATPKADLISMFQHIFIERFQNEKFDSEHLSNMNDS
jgi:hypothetical protein